MGHNKLYGLIKEGTLNTNHPRFARSGVDDRIQGFILFTSPTTSETEHMSILIPFLSSESFTSFDCKN